MKRNNKLRGQMAPFDREALDLIRASLRAKRQWRDLALLNVGIDTMLRGCDLLRLKFDDLMDHEGKVVGETTLRQKKTGGTVQVNLMERTRESILTLFAHEGKFRDDYLFTSRSRPHGKQLSEVALRLIVKDWARLAGLDPSKYAGHSLRRTKAAFIYKETGDVATVRELLGHSTLAHTQKYLGVNARTAGAVARKFDI
jgi:integrase